MHVNILQVLRYLGKKSFEGENFFYEIKKRGDGGGYIFNGLYSSVLCLPIHFDMLTTNS